VPSYRAAVVSSGGRVTGIVGEDILVLPNMDPRHLPEVLKAEGVVAEVGGALAHLAIVCRERGKTMMVMPNARAVLAPGMHVTLLPARCEIRIEGFDDPVGSDRRVGR
jgi:phosphohistidine swiveling domain-containing protein